MYICICKGITDNAIREAVHQGAERMRDLKPVWVLPSNAEFVHAMLKWYWIRH